MAETEQLTLWQRIGLLNWPLILLATTLSCMGFAMLYSAAGGNWDPWALRQIIRFGIGFVAMVLVALIPIALLMRLSYIVYAFGVGLLLLVEAVGYIGMGAQRWLSVGIFNLQPSELMKLFLTLALARYFQNLSERDTDRLPLLIAPLFMTAIPAALILHQPNLGTATITCGMAAAIFWATGVGWKKFATVAGLGLAALPIGWQFLHDYQKQRVLTFLNPEADPLGSGYNILQSEIAIGSGGMLGRGFMQGSQGQLNFLPEKETDFIFTMLAEEFGFTGGMTTLALYTLLLAFGLIIALRSRNHFGRLIAVGVTSIFFLHIFINIAMVMGLLPVVGVPLPLLSYGGTILITTLIGVGLLLNVHINRDVEITRNEYS